MARHVQQTLFLLAMVSLHAVGARPMRPAEKPIVAQASVSAIIPAETLRIVVVGSGHSMPSPSAYLTLSISRSGSPEIVL